LLLLIVLAATLIISLYRDKIFPPENLPPSPTKAVRSATTPSPAAPAAPHASDANWTLTLGTNAIPDSPAAGRIHGLDFVVEHAFFQNSTLTLRTGTHGPVDFGVLITFSGAQVESLAGQTINIAADAEQAARVALCWRDNMELMRGIFTNGYAMRLQFGMMEGDRLPGKIYLCTPDADKSYLLGSFSAVTRKRTP
jgi:hypothetical protein